MVYAVRVWCHIYLDIHLDIYLDIHQSVNAIKVHSLVLPSSSTVNLRS